jgi:hypothetical protein
MRIRAVEAQGQVALTTAALGMAWVFGGVIATIACSGLALGAGTGRLVIVTFAIAIGVGLMVRGLRRSRQ